MAQQSKDARLSDPASLSERVELEHPGIDGTQWCEKRAQKHWEARGWKPVPASRQSTTGSES